MSKDVAGFSLQGVRNEFWAFVDAVDWSQTWLYVLFSYHLMWLVVSFLLIPTDASQSTTTARAVIFVACLAHVALASTLNQVAALHWSKFATENYFTEDGFFTVVFFAMPMLLIAMLNLVLLLISTAKLAVQVKALQLGAKKEKKKTKKQD